MVASGTTGTDINPYEKAGYDISSVGDSKIKVGRNSIGDSNGMISNGYVQIGATTTGDYYTLGGDLDDQCFGCSVSALEDFFMCVGSSGSANAGYQAFIRDGGGANTWAEYANNVDRSLIETQYNALNPGSPITIDSSADIGQAVRLYFDENDSGTIKGFVSFSDSDGTINFVGHMVPVDVAPGVVEWEFDSFTVGNPSSNFGWSLAGRSDTDSGLYVSDHEVIGRNTQLYVDRYVLNGSTIDSEVLDITYGFDGTINPTKMNGLDDGTISMSHDDGTYVSWKDSGSLGYEEAEIKFEADDGADEYAVVADFYQVAGGAASYTDAFIVKYVDNYAGTGQDSFDLGVTFTTSQDIGVIGGGALSAFNIDQTNLTNPIVQRSMSQPDGAVLVNIAYDPKDVGIALLTPLMIGVGENDKLVEVVPTVDPDVPGTTLDPTMGTTTISPIPDDDLAKILEYWNIVLGRKGC
jgi:hypothetical protein